MTGETMAGALLRPTTEKALSRVNAVTWGPADAGRSQRRQMIRGSAGRPSGRRGCRRKAGHLHQVRDRRR
jgi:hypothetical protein